MPTFDRTDQFLRDQKRLSDQQREAVREAIGHFVADLKAGQGFRKGLRVKGVQGKPGVFEMTWADDGRATFSYGNSIQEGEPHVVWHRIGTHEIF